MWRMILRIELWLIVILGTIGVCFAGFQLMDYSVGAGLGVIVGGIILILILCAGLGVTLELADNVSKIARNTQALKESMEALEDSVRGRAPQQPEYSHTGYTRQPEYAQPQNYGQAQGYGAEPEAGWRCPVCGSVNDSDHRFCLHCGTQR